MKQNPVFNLVMAALFLALGLVLPFLTGQVPQIGSMLLPMHLPVMLCGLLCGWKYGALVGFVVPLLRSMLFSMPKLYPTALAMAFELATYGLIIGLIYSLSKRSVASLYISLISAMLAGRAVWGVVTAILLGVGGDGFTFAAFIAGAFTNAIPGIILQIVVIPPLVRVLEKSVLKERKKAV